MFTTILSACAINVVSIQAINPKVSLSDALAISGAICKYSQKYGLKPSVLGAVIAVESRFKAFAVGGAGEVGLMQLHPKFHYTSFSIEENIATGAAYLARIKKVFSKKYPGLDWVTFYNSGPNSKGGSTEYADRVRVFHDLFEGGLGNGRSVQRPVQQVKRRSIGNRQDVRGIASSIR